MLNVSYNTWSRTKFWIIIVLIFSLGSFFGSALSQAANTSKAVTAQSYQVKLNDWKELKSLDDEAFSLTLDTFDYCSDALDATSKLDANGVDIALEGIYSTNTKFQELAVKRGKGLKKLGY